jgi:adenylate cyclase
MGEHTVKNISEPVRIYRILFRPEFEGKVIEASANRKAKFQKPYVIATAAILICSGALLWFFYSRAIPIEPASIEKMAYPLPEKPSIAVLPFDNLSGDPNQEFFSDGLTEEIITTLSKIPKIFVIARNSTDTYT